MYAEDIYKNQEKLNLDLIESSENGFSVVNATIPKTKLGKGYLNKRTLLSVSSCGICGKQKLEDIKLNGNILSNNTSIDTLDLKAMFNTMRKAQNVFHKTGGSHAAAIFDAQKKILVLREDIGRHNAVDKAVGSLLNNENLNKCRSTVGKWQGIL